MRRSIFNYKLIDMQVLPTGPTIMESWGTSTAFQLSTYDHYKELGCYDCLYCRKNLRYEDPSLEKHMGHCIYHPDAHLKFNTDQRSSGNPTRFIPRKLGVHSDLSVIWPTDVPREHTLQAAAATEPVVQLYDKVGSMTLDVQLTLELPNEQLKQGPEPQSEYDDPDEQYARPVPPSDEITRFNHNPADPRIELVIGLWASMSADNPGRGQFYLPCFMCGEKRGGHILMPCGHGPVGAPCFMKFVDDEINVCPKCTVQVEYAILSTETFELNNWVELS